MSYCVNCGVELDKTQRACPLCDTAVLNPAQPVDTESPTPYPQAVSLPKSARRKYLAFVMSGVLLITSVVCLLINFVLSDSGLWSLFVVFSCSLVWLLFILPLVVRRSSPYLYILVDAAAVALYIFSMSATLDSPGWFLEIVLPALGLGAFLSISLAFWLGRGSREWPGVCVFVTVSVSLVSLLVDILCHLALSGSPGIGYSAVSTACGAALVVFFAVIYRNRRFRAWLTRKTHV